MSTATLIEAEASVEASVPPVAPAAAAASVARASLAALMRSVGDIPFGRIVFDPWPGTATERDLLTLVERDKRLCELIDGTLVEKPMGYRESVVARRLSTALGQFVDARNLGMVAGPDATLRMRGGRVRLPDVSFVALGSLPGGVVPDEAIPSRPPTLAVEVLSDSNSRAETEQKLREFFDSGCLLAWVIDPRSRTAEVYRSPEGPIRRLAAHEDLDGEDVVPGFRIRLADLFVGL